MTYFVGGSLLSKSSPGDVNLTLTVVELRTRVVKVVTLTGDVKMSFSNDVQCNGWIDIVGYEIKFCGSSHFVHMYRDKLRNKQKNWVATRFCTINHYLLLRKCSLARKMTPHTSRTLDGAMKSAPGVIST